MSSPVRSWPVRLLCGNPCCTRAIRGKTARQSHRARAACLEMGLVIQVQAYPLSCCDGCSGHALSRRIGRLMRRRREQSGACGLVAMDQSVVERGAYSMGANYLRFRYWRFVEVVRARKGLGRAGRCALHRVRAASAWRQCLLRGQSQTLRRIRFHHAALGLQHPR
jgi:hypothetical protein